MGDAIKAIATIIMIGIILGITLTSLWVIIITLRSENEPDDEEEKREAQKYDHWDQK